MGESFSLLLPVYAGDRADHLRRSLQSSVAEQRRAPDEVVIVLDGPIGDDLREVVTAFAAAADIPVTVVPLQVNVGLGEALEAGLAACRHDIVARQDADDISLAHRFAVQLPIIEAGADIVGSGLLEFGEDESDIVGRRTPPTTPSPSPGSPASTTRSTTPPWSTAGLPSGPWAATSTWPSWRTTGCSPG
jgi:glycosyltransferase involved in cell wall biosynthesis